MTVATARSFSIVFYDEKGEECACDWNWPEQGKREWSMSKKVDSVVWDWGLPFDREGRKVLLKAFGLIDEEICYPLDLLRHYSPATLVDCRRRLEQRDKLPFLNVVSSTMGDHVQAELVQ